MAKGRDDYPIGDVVARGMIPWNYEDFGKIMDFIQELKATPPDNWNLKSPRLTLVDDDGDESEISFNMLETTNQISLFIRNMYPTTVQTAMSHIYRWMEIGKFLTRNHVQLMSDGLLQDADDGQVGYHEGLLTTLCTLPYTMRVKNDNNQMEHRYDYDEVVVRDRELEETDSLTRRKIHDLA